MTCNHSYANGKCIYCGSPQQRFNGSKEVKLSDIKDSHKIAPQARFGRRKRITSENQYATDQLITFLGVPVKEFARFARYVKKLGPANIHGIINQIKGTDKWCRETNGKPLNKIGYFINNWCKTKK